MSIFLSQAQKILNKVDLTDPAVSQAKEILNGMDKTAGVSDALADPRLSTAINLLTPFVVNYKVNQVLKLLKELSKSQPKTDPQTGLRRYV